MPVPLAIAAILAKLAENGLSLLAGAITAKGKDVIEDKLGINLDNALQSEEGMLKLKQLELTHEEFLINASIKQAEMNLEEIREENKNTQGARVMNENIQNSEHASKFAKDAAYILDYIIVGSTLLMILMLLFKGVPVENKEFFYMALGSLLTMCVTVVNFHRGSSSRSAGKDATIQMLSQGRVK